MHVRRVDLGEINGRIFLNNVSIGMYPALVAHRERYQRMHGWKKLPAHIVAAWQVFRRFPRSRLTVEMNGRRITRRTPVLLIGNNAYDGGLLAEAKRQVLDAGKVWVCIAPGEGVFVLLRTGWAFATGHLSELPELDTELAESLTVTARKRTMRVAIDGETLRMEIPLEIRSLPGALRAIVP
jgi:diacylglycerol kinase family enzyme